MKPSSLQCIYVVTTVFQSFPLHTIALPCSTDISLTPNSIVTLFMVFLLVLRQLASYVCSYLFHQMLFHSLLCAQTNAMHPTLLNQPTRLQSQFSFDAPSSLTQFIHNSAYTSLARHLNYIQSPFSCSYISSLIPIHHCWY